MKFGLVTHNFSMNITTRPVMILSRKVTIEYTNALRSVRQPINSAVTLNAVTIVIELPTPINMATMYTTVELLPTNSVTTAAIIPIIAPKK